MKSLICGIIGLFVFFGCILNARASRRADSELPEVFMMLNDENFNMTFDGKVLHTSGVKDPELGYSCHDCGIAECLECARR